MKVIYSGLESSGKSLKLAIETVSLIDRNAKWLKKSGIVRPICSNIKFTEKLENYAKEKGIPVNYWQHKDQLIRLTECDVIIDEVANYWNARMWQDMTTEELQWLSQGAKQGIEIYGGSQDFAMVDKGFRRLCNHLFFIRKLCGSRRPAATKPPVKRIWGICLIWELDPMAYDEEKSKFAMHSMLPSWFYIERVHCELFETNRKITKALPLPFKHIERGCEDEDCTFHKVQHV